MSTFSNYNFDGQKALIRVDFNVPLDDKFNITDDTRMSAAIPTIKKILADGGKVILMSHFGRPKNGPEDKYSLKHLVNHLYELLNKEGETTTNVFFAEDCIGEKATLTAGMLHKGEVLLWRICVFIKKKKKVTKPLQKNYQNWEICG